MRGPTISILLRRTAGRIVVFAVASVAPGSLTSSAIESIRSAALLMGPSLLLFPIIPTAFPIFLSALRFKIFLFGHRVHFRRYENILAGLMATRTKQSAHLSRRFREGQSIAEAGQHQGVLILRQGSILRAENRGEFIGETAVHKHARLCLLSLHVNHQIPIDT